MSRKIDKFFKDELQSITTPYQPGHWDEMSSILDDRSNSGRGWLLWWVAAFVGLSFALFLWMPMGMSTADNTPEAAVTSFTEHVKASLGVEIDEAPALSEVRLDKSKSYSFGLSSKELTKYALRGMEFNSDRIENESRMGDELFSSFGITQSNNPDNSDPASGVWVNLAERGGLATSLENEVKHNALPALDLIELEKLFSGEWSDLPTTEIDDSPRYLGPMRWGMGASYGGQSFRDVGLFLELDIPLSRYFHLIFRPGVSYASLNESPILIEKRLYDFGLEESKIKLDVERELQWEIPVYLMVENHRHHFGLGGGLRLDGWRRASKVESIRSDKDRLERGEESNERVASGEKVWLANSGPFNLFLEGFYQYRLSPSWQAGLRSRVMMSSAVRESGLSENRVQYGIYVTYLLN